MNDQGEEAQRKSGEETPEEEEEEKEEQQQESSSSSQSSAEAKSIGQKNMAKKRQNAPVGTSHLLSDKEQIKFKDLFPELQICGKMNEYYRVTEPLELIKESQERIFLDLDEFKKKLIAVMNKQHQ